MSPPIKDGAPGAVNTEGNHNSEPHVRTDKSSRFDDLAARGRRCAAKKRMTPIGSCVCNVRDPDVDVHRCNVKVEKIFTDKQVDAAVAAALHLVLLGTPGIFDKATCRAIYRSGNRDLATKCFSHSYGEAA